MEIVIGERQRKGASVLSNPVGTKVSCRYKAHPPRRIFGGVLFLEQQENRMDGPDLIWNRWLTD